MDNIKNKTLEIRVNGRVQGVDFRRSVANFANSLRIFGYVENLNDGSVKVVGQGDEKSLEELLRWCQRGSILAKIESMSYRWYTEEKIYEKFTVQRDGSFIGDQIKSFFNLGKHIKEDIVFDINKINTPKHIVIIPNGNRRWAKEQGLKPWKAYWYVQNKIVDLIDIVKKLRIDYLTIWGFSTENWKRDSEEVEQLMKLFESTIDKFQDKLFAESVKFKHLGRRDRLPSTLLAKIEKLEKATEGFIGRSINVAIDYGGRDELLRAIERAIRAGKNNISEDEFSQFLDTSGLPDPDLIIRTAGEQRLSGMMPWQSVYSEYVSSNVYFPDFGVEHLKEAIVEFNNRRRTFGGDTKSVQQDEKIQLNPVVA